MTIPFQCKTPYYGVGYEELSGSPKYTFRRGTGISGIRRFHCNWSDGFKFCQELLGVISFTGGIPNYVAPLSAPGFGLLIVDEIDADPFDPESPDGDTNLSLGLDASTYGNVGALIVAQYKSMDLNKDTNRPNIPQGTYLSISESLGTEYQTLPGRYLKWADPPYEKLPDDVNPGVIIPTGQYVITWSRVVQPPDSTIDDTRGMVNSTTFLGKDPGTMLFVGVNKNRQFQFDDSNTGLYELQYTFSYKKPGWNYFYDPSRGGPFKVKLPITGDPLFESADFTQLFGYNG